MAPQSGRVESNISGGLGVHFKIPILSISPFLIFFYRKVIKFDFVLNYLVKLRIYKQIGTYNCILDLLSLTEINMIYLL